MFYMQVETDLGNFFVTQHFRDQCRNRVGVKNDASLEAFIRQTLNCSKEIVKSARGKLTSLLRHGCKESRYLYDPKSSWVFVTERNTRSGKYDILRTIYSGATSQWVTESLDRES